MGSITLNNVDKVYDNGFHAVNQLSLEVAEGEFLVLVGPSGCGKSTALRMIAGLETISGGEMVIGGRVVNDLDPKDRDIAMVFQSYALYPHLSVRDNIAFALKLAKMPKDEIDQRVNEAAAMEVAALGEAHGVGETAPYHFRNADLNHLGHLDGHADFSGDGRGHFITTGLQSFDDFVDDVRRLLRVLDLLQRNRHLPFDLLGNLVEVDQSLVTHVVASDRFLKRSRIIADCLDLLGRQRFLTKAHHKGIVGRQHVRDPVAGVTLDDVFLKVPLGI